MSVTNGEVLSAPLEGVFPQGDPLADVGTEGWASRTRIVLLSKLDGTRFTIHDFKLYLDQFFLHQGWHLLTRKDGSQYRSFQDFVEEPRPWGLGTPYTSFRALIDRLTVSGDGRADNDANQYTGPRVDSCPGDKNASMFRQSRLRAVNRSPVIIQHMWDKGWIGLLVAARFGPVASEEVKTQMEHRAETLGKKVDEWRSCHPNSSLRELKVEVNRLARDLLGELHTSTTCPSPVSSPLPSTPLEQLNYWWKKASVKERKKFMKLVEADTHKEKSP
jgi:hypothetical protein